MAREKTIINDLTQGRVMSRLIRFTMPLMLANTLQVCYNLVDMFFVGQFAGTDALSAVSIASNVTVLMFFCFMGIATGGQIYVAQTVGSGRLKELDKIVGNSLTLCAHQPDPDAGHPSGRAHPAAHQHPGVHSAHHPQLSGDLHRRQPDGGPLQRPVRRPAGHGDSFHPTPVRGHRHGGEHRAGLPLCGGVPLGGAAGAALATVIGQTVACLFALGYLFVKRSSFGFDFSPRGFRLEKRQWR